jgi:hypothetical protein
MAEIYLRKLGKHLIPADTESEELLRKMPADKIMRLKYTMVRNAAFHRKGFSMLQAMFDMQEHFDQFEPFRKWIVMKSGYAKTYAAPNGYTLFEPESLSFGSMDQERFEKVYSAIIDTFLREFPRISKEELDTVLEYAE